MKLNKPFHGDYAITQAYGVQSVTGKRHMGIDWALPMGTPVFAAADGMVTFAGKDTTGYGNCVIIRHGDGSGTVYAHLDSLMVKEQHFIIAGIGIGFSGNTGTSTGPHLHFEYRRKADDYKSAIDPMPFIPANEKPVTEPVASANVKAESGIVKVVAPNGVRIRLEPNLPDGEFFRWAFAGEEFEKTGRIAESSGLPWAEVNIRAYIAIQDTDGTVLLEDI